jgi:hypothetical protein
MVSILCVAGTKGLERDSRHLTGSEVKQIERKMHQTTFHFSFNILHLHSDKTIYVPDK